MCISSLTVNPRELGIVRFVGPDDADFWCKRRSYQDDTP